MVVVVVLLRSRGHHALVRLLLRHALRHLQNVCRVSLPAESGWAAWACADVTFALVAEAHTSRLACWRIPTRLLRRPLSTLSTGNAHASLRTLQAFTLVSVALRRRKKGGCAAARGSSHHGGHAPWAMSLQVTWSAFVVVFFVFKCGVFSPAVEEYTWGIMDIVGKVRPALRLGRGDKACTRLTCTLRVSCGIDMSWVQACPSHYVCALPQVIFSSGLLQSNFISIEERRRQAAKLVEEGRQKQVRCCASAGRRPTYPPPMPHAMLLLPLAHVATGAGGADVPRAPGERTVLKSGRGWERCA